MCDITISMQGPLNSVRCNTMPQVSLKPLAQSKACKIIALDACDIVKKVCYFVTCYCLFTYFYALPQ